MAEPGGTVEFLLALLLLPPCFHKCRSTKGRSCLARSVRRRAHDLRHGCVEVHRCRCACVLVSVGAGGGVRMSVCVMKAHKGNL